MAMVAPITDVVDSAATLRWATEVEHATIPPYEYAFWSVMERVWRSENHGPLVDGAMVPLMNHAQKPIALALLREPWPDGSGEVAGPRSPGIRCRSTT